jgi:DcmR-like sensory protein
MQSGSLKPDGDDSGQPDGSIRLAGSNLGARRHICAFFNSHDDQYRLLLPFIKDGLDLGEMAVHIINPRRRDEHIRQLQTVGIDAHAAQQEGQLDVRDWADAHLRDGFFDEKRTLALMADIRQRSKKQGFRRIRFVTDMMWALEDRPDVDGLLEYEASANLVPSGDPVICVYDLTKVGGDVVVDVMRTHPMIIIGGILQENPFFVPPDQFLRELHARRGTS